MKNSITKGQRMNFTETIPFNSSSLSELFANDRQKYRECMRGNPDFKPFSSMPDSLFSLVAAEKMRLSLFPTTRLIKRKDQNQMYGTLFTMDAKEDAFHPKELAPFELKGVWVPEYEGHLFAESLIEISSSMIRTSTKGREILYLVHPKSEPLLNPLLKKYSSTEQKVAALALSSFRSLLISVESQEGQYQFAMVKVSLNEEINGVNRVVTLKESALSIGNSIIFKKKETMLNLFFETFSFVPKDEYLDPPLKQRPGAGMIERKIPDFLMDSQSKVFLVPMFALTGKNNSDLFNAILKAANKSATDFFMQNILLPLVEIQTDLLFKQYTSIEAHGQNLLLKIDTSNPSQPQFSLMLRDMGGVNIDFTYEEFKCLPPNLQNEDYFYRATHLQDAASAIEKFVAHFLFPLTKTAFKSDYIEQSDQGFSLWKQRMKTIGLEENWHKQADHPDTHAMEISEEKFVRYGFFEKIYGSLLLGALHRQGVFEALQHRFPHLEQTLHNMLFDPNNSLSKNLDTLWFETLIKSTYRRAS